MTFINTSLNQEYMLPVVIGMTHQYKGTMFQTLVHYIDEIEMFNDLDRWVYSPRHNIIFRNMTTSEMYLLHFDADHRNGKVFQFDTTEPVPTLGEEGVCLEHGFIAPNENGTVFVKAIVKCEPQPVKVGMMLGTWNVVLVEEKLLVLRNGDDTKVIYHDKIPDGFPIKWSE